MIKLFISVTIFSSLAICSCGPQDPKYQYSELVKSERARNVRFDSIFLGYYFGMPRKEFYDHSWKMNKEGTVMDGVNNLFIQYTLRDNQLRDSGSMNFFPDFYQDKIFKMRTEFAYDDWAPWNKSRFADSLLPDVLNFFKDWYPEGNPFITITDTTRGTIYVKVDGNRRILIGKFDERLVKAEITDITVEDALLKVGVNEAK